MAGSVNFPIKMSPGTRTLRHTVCCVVMSAIVIISMSTSEVSPTFASHTRGAIYPPDELRTSKSENQVDNHQEVSQTRLKRRPKVANMVPEFSAPIGNVTAVVGRDVRLVCTVEHLGQYQVAWMKMETHTILSIDTNIIITNYRIFLIPDEEERKWVLHIKDVQESDRGFYQCQVNTNPMRSTSGYLEVVVPPTIIESQSSQLAETVENSSISIQCKANGHPRPTISWHRDDGLPIRLSGRGSQSPAEERVNGDSNGGSFTGIEDVTSTDLQLANYFNPSNEPSKIVGASSQSFTLDRQHHIVQQQQTIRPTSLLNDIRSDKLTLNDVDRSMAGIYVCTASNGIPTQVNKRIPVYVKFPPKTSTQNKFVTVRLGDRLELECLIEGFPKPDSYFSKRSFAHRRLDGAGRWPRVLSGPGESERRATFYRPNILSGNSPPKYSVRLVNFTSLLPLPIAASSDQSQADGESGSHDEILVMDKQSFIDNNQPYDGMKIDQAKTNRPCRKVLVVGDDTNGGDDPAPLIDSPQPRRLAGAQSSTSRISDPKAYVSVKQTALNSYTYKLQLTIAKMHPEDYGEYSCIASNSMGSSESGLMVRRADRVVELIRSSPTDPNSKGTSYDDRDYQRDSLDNQNGGAGANRANTQQQSSKDYRRGSSGNRVVYDENYLQAIKTRQNPAITGKLQQKLKLMHLNDRNLAADDRKPMTLALSLTIGLIVTLTLCLSLDGSQRLFRI